MNGGKDSAEGHSSGGAGKTAHILAMDQSLTSGVTGDDKEVEEVTDMFADLAKKVRAPNAMKPLMTR
jgi:translation initiation factor 2 subunit 2